MDSYGNESAGGVVHESAAIGEQVIIAPTSAIGRHSALGDHVTVGAQVSVEERCTIGARTSIDEGVVICERVVIGSGVHIGRGAIIGPGVRISDYVRIGADAEIAECSQVGDSVAIGSNACIQPNARLGNGARVQNGAKVESRALVGANTYVGGAAIVRRGAVIGPDVYLGRRSRIGKQARIGRGSDVGENARIGRGVVLGQMVAVHISAVIRRWARIGNGARIGYSHHIYMFERVMDGCHVGTNAQAPVPKNDLADKGFTLIELCVVLVIIGLIVGGVLVGQNLISAAAVRAQISQIEKYQTAVATFREKYGELPGDMQPSLVAQFGFTAGAGRSGAIGDGDGNGLLYGGNGYGSVSGSNQGGENLYFWEDLSTNSHLIEGSFNAVAGPLSGGGGTGTCTSVATCSVYFPYAKIGNNAFVYVYGAGLAPQYGAAPGGGPNFFGVSVINSMGLGAVGQGAIPPAPGVTVAQAQAIDSKIDDGLPLSGNVIAQYETAGYSGSVQISAWASNSSTATSCFVFKGGPSWAAGIFAYSIDYNNGALMNCGLSFKFMTGD